MDIHPGRPDARCGGSRRGCDRRPERHHQIPGQHRRHSTHRLGGPFSHETQYDRMQHLMLRAPFYLSQLGDPAHAPQRGRQRRIGHMASIHAHICTVKKAGLQHHQIRPAGAGPVDFRRGGKAGPLLYHQHRFVKTPVGPGADSGPGGAARHLPGGGGAAM